MHAKPEFTARGAQAGKPLADQLLDAIEKASDTGIRQIL